MSGAAAPVTAAGAAPRAGDVVLEIHGISAAYGEMRVLSDVTFSIRHGEIVALLGPNGCGKTTLLRIIGKLVTPTAGVVRINGREIGAMDARELARTMASVAQVHRTSFPFSVLDIMLTGRMPYLSIFATPKQDDVDKCRSVLDRFGVLHLEEKSYTKLSGGERQLVMIARALAQEPRILLLDEPTTYLDLRNQVRVLDTIHDLARADDLTVLMTIHDPNQAFSHADHAVLLRKLGAHEGVDPSTGHPHHPTNTIATGTPAEVLTPANVHEAYGVQVDLIEHAHRRLLVPAD